MVGVRGFFADDLLVLFTYLDVRLSEGTELSRCLERLLLVQVFGDGFSMTLKLNDRLDSDLWDLEPFFYSRL